MAFPLTEEQKRIVDDRGGELLVSAAAGSGKTRVLVERLMDRVTREGLDLAVDGDFVYAKGTTLGGDDGIAVAMALALLDAEGLPHPRLEAVFTVDEEIGLLGAASIDDSKLKKNVLARGVDDLVMVADDALTALDTAGTAEELAAVVGEGDFDLILCGDGSADEYAQQVDVQLAARLGVPSVNAVTAIKAEGDSMVVERTLEDVVEEVEVPLPAVIAVTPDVATPRIPGMKDILAAGKKPMDVKGAPVAPVSAVEVVSCAAPEAAERACNVADASADGAIEAFAAALKAAL